MLLTRVGIFSTFVFKSFTVTLENLILIMRPDLTYNKQIRTKTVRPDYSPFLVKNNPGVELLSDKGNEDLVNYVEWLNLYEDPNLVVLSSVHHYFYAAEEMKSVRTVVNLISLNELKDIKGFLHSIYTILTPGSNFVGFFKDSKNHNGYSLIPDDVDEEAVEYGIVSKIPFINALYNLMDSRTYRNLSKNEAMFILENNGFKVRDITVLNSISYFHAKRI